MTPAPHSNDATLQSINRVLWRVGIAVVAALVLNAWLTDFVTLEGEWTLYTARCIGTAWQMDRCPGRLEAAERYQYTIPPDGGRIQFRVVGAKRPPGWLVGCTVKDERNWRCLAQEGSEHPPTMGLVQGMPLPLANADDARRAVSKAQWYFLSITSW